MKKRKKILLTIGGVIFGIIVLSAIYVYRNIRIAPALFEQIDHMGSREDTAKLVKILSNRWNPWWYRQCAFEQLAGIDSDPMAIKPLVKILERRWELPPLRGEAAFTLGCIGDERAIEPLIKALDYGLGMKEAALKGLTLIKVKDKKVASVARKLLNDESEAIRDLAIIAIGVHGGEEDVSLLIERLKNGDSGERSNAAAALGKIGSKRAVEPLIERLENDPDKYVRWSCCVPLGEIGDKRAVEPLIKALKGIMQLEAAEALAMIGDRRAIEPLRSKIHDCPDKWWRNKLKEAYKKLTGHEYQENSE